MKADDLAGMVFGRLTVIRRAENVIQGGQKKVAWLCRCECGSECTVTAAALKSGNTKSCGCLNRDSIEKRKKRKNRKICPICGKEFFAPPTGRVTCSRGCMLELGRRNKTGRARSEKFRRAISAGTKGRDMSALQPLGTAAAQASPLSGRFETNINAKDWHLVSPEGEHFYFHSLAYWLRENGEKYFGCRPDTHEFENVCAGIRQAKRGALGKTKRPFCRYKGWTVIPTPEDLGE